MTFALDRVGTRDGKHQCDVLLAAIKLIEHPIASPDSGLDTNIGAGAGETCQHHGQPCFGQIFRNPDADGTLRVETTNRIHSFVVQFQNAAGIGQDHLTCFGELQPAIAGPSPSSCEQWLADLPLQLVDLQTDRRLRPPNNARSPRKTPRIDGSNQRAEHGHIEICQHVSN